MSKKKIILSMVVTLLTLFIHTSNPQQHIYTFGFPLNFLNFFGTEVEYNNFSLLKFDSLTNLDFNILFFILNILFFYYILIFLSFAIKKIKSVI